MLARRVSLVSAAAVVFGCGQAQVESSRAGTNMTDTSSPIATAAAQPSATTSAVAQEPRAPHVPEPEPQASAEVASADPPPGVPVALYAELFTKGKKWTFRAHEYGKSSTGTCSVVEVRSLEWGLASRIACEGFDAPSFFTGDPFSGWWAAVPEGLVRLEDRMPTQVPALREATPLLPSKPKPRFEKILDEDEPPFWDEITIRAAEGGWCIKTLSRGHDSAWWSVCVKAGAGFRSGVVGWRGGSTQEKTFRVE